jgi:hypothetical protein
MSGLAIPGFDGVGDVVDVRRLHTLARIPRQEKRVAEREVALPPRIA